MYKSSQSATTQRKSTSKSRLSPESRKRNDELLLTRAPVTIMRSELKRICIEIRVHGISPAKSIAASKEPLKLDLGDPSLFTLARRRGEGSKPIFANVKVNQPYKKEETSPKPGSSNEPSLAKKTTPNKWVLQRESSSRERSRSKRRSRTGSSDRRKHSKSRSTSRKRSISRHRSRSRRSHSSGKRSHRSQSPRRYRRKHGDSRSPKRYDRREHSTRRNERGRSSERHRRHYSPKRSEMPVMIPAVDPAYPGYYMPFTPPELLMGYGMHPGMFRPRLPPAYLHRPMLRHPRPPFLPRSTVRPITQTVTAAPEPAVTNTDAPITNTS